MIKKMIGIIAAVFMSLVFCCGCGDKKFVAFEKTNLETAFNNAWISQEHLKSIAYYYNGEVDEPAFALIPKLQLSEKTVNNIKLSYMQQEYIKSVYPNATVDNARTYRYYGTYNNYAVVFILDDLFQYDLKFEDEKIIGGVSFYNYCGLQLYKIM